MTIPVYTYSHNEQRLTQVGVAICKLQACMWAYTGIPQAREKHGQTDLLLHIEIDMCQVTRSSLFWVAVHLRLVTDIAEQPIRHFTLEPATDTLSRNVGDIAPTLCNDMEEQSRCSGRLDVWRWDRLPLRVGYALSNNPEQQISRLLCNEGLKSRVPRWRPWKLQYMPDECSYMLLSET